MSMQMQKANIDECFLKFINTTIKDNKNPLKKSFYDTKNEKNNNNNKNNDKCPALQTAMVEYANGKKRLFISVSGYINNSNTKESVLYLQKKASEFNKKNNTKVTIVTDMVKDRSDALALQKETLKYHTETVNNQYKKYDKNEFRHMKYSLKNEKVQIYRKKKLGTVCAEDNMQHSLMNLVKKNKINKITWGSSFAYDKQAGEFKTLPPCKSKCAAIYTRPESHANRVKEAHDLQSKFRKERQNISESTKNKMQESAKKNQHKISKNNYTIKNTVIIGKNHQELNEKRNNKLFNENKSMEFSTQRMLKRLKYDNHTSMVGHENEFMHEYINELSKDFPKIDFKLKQNNFYKNVGNPEKALFHEADYIPEMDEILDFESEYAYNHGYLHQNGMFGTNNNNNNDTENDNNYNNNYRLGY